MATLSAVLLCIQLFYMFLIASITVYLDFKNELIAITPIVEFNQGCERAQQGKWTKMNAVTTIG